MSKNNKSGLRLNLLIARSHQVATQLVGVQLSIANLLAIAVSAASVVAGTVTLTIQRYPASWALWIAAGIIGLGLAILIEGMTLGALIRIRLASKKIKLVDEQVEAERDKIDWFALDKSTRRTKEAELRWKRARATRQFRKMRTWSIPIVIVGSLASAVAGGMFYHTVLAGLGAWESIAVAALFPFVVTCTFISSELFKDTQEEAIKEGYSGGGLADAALREETRRMSFQAVHDGILCHFNDTEIQEELKLGTMGMLKDIIGDLRQSITVSLPAKTIVIEAAREEVPEPDITDSIPAPIIDIQTGMRIDTEESHLPDNGMDTETSCIEYPIGQECSHLSDSRPDRNRSQPGNNNNSEKRQKAERILCKNPGISVTKLAARARLSRSYAGQIRSEYLKRQESVNPA